MVQVLAPPLDVLSPTVRVFDVLHERIKARGIKPKRAFTTIGDIAFALSCSQLAVSARRVYAGQPSVEGAAIIKPHGGYAPLSLEIGIAYTDCYPLPKGEQPRPEAQENSLSRAFMADAGIVLGELFDAYFTDDLVDACQNTSIGPVVFVGPSGGVAGVTVTMAVQLN